MYRPGSRAQRSFCGDQRSQLFGRQPVSRGFQGRSGGRFGGRDFDAPFGGIGPPSRFGPPGMGRFPPSRGQPQFPPSRGQSQFPPSRGQPRGFGWGNENQFGWNGNARRGPGSGAQWGSQADQLNTMLSQQNIFRDQQGFSGMPNSNFPGPGGPDVISPVMGSQGGQFGAPSPDFAGTVSSFGGPVQDFPGSSVGGSMFSGQEFNPQSMGLDGSQPGFAGTQPMLFEGAGTVRSSVPQSDVQTQSSSPSGQQQAGPGQKAQPQGPQGPGAPGQFKQPSGPPLGQPIGAPGQFKQPSGAPLGQPIGQATQG